MTTHRSAASVPARHASMIACRLLPTCDARNPRRSFIAILVFSRFPWLARGRLLQRDVAAGLLVQVPPTTRDAHQAPGWLSLGLCSVLRGVREKRSGGA